jgi:hypothetical protein
VGTLRHPLGEEPTPDAVRHPDDGGTEVVGVDRAIEDQALTGGRAWATQDRHPRGDHGHGGEPAKA